MKPAPPVADVCLLLEGTYPYILGGVSAWVDQIIRGLPDVTFSLFYIGSTRKGQKQQYTLPPNVLTLQEMYLHEPLSARSLSPAATPKLQQEKIYAALRAFYLERSMAEKVPLFWNILDALENTPFTFGNLSEDIEAWEILQETYAAFAPEESFIDFFWTIRFLHLPLWALWENRRRVPAARVYHSISTGYAGLIGSLAARTRQAPFLLTEHGVYTKERIAEISQADWVFESESTSAHITEGMGKLKQLWIGLFRLLGRIAYDRAAQIITLYEGNAYTQIEFGAPASKIRIVPNGIEPKKFNNIRLEIQNRWRLSPTIKTVGFIGRIVPIKDVKTLLRAARLVCENCPDVQFILAGPTNEDPLYFEECEKIVKLLQIDAKVQFLGMQKLMEVLPFIDLLVLTSISEGLPLVVLEAMATGIPVVATDVGACRELIFGRTPEDKAIGRAGKLTKILSPQETANALTSILQDSELWHKLGHAGRQRVETFYSMQTMLDSYHEIYRELASAEPAPPPNLPPALLLPKDQLTTD